MKRLKISILLGLVFWLLIFAAGGNGCPFPAAEKNWGDEEIVFPSHPSGQKAKEFFEAFLLKDQARLEKFFTQTLPEEKIREVSPQERARKILSLRERWGEVSLTKVVSPRTQEVIAFFLSGSKEVWQLGLVFETKGEKVYLKSLAIDQAGPEVLLPPLPPLTINQAWERIEAELASATAEDRFSGVVLIARDFKPIFFKSWGMANREFSVPNRLDTKFNLGSINKIFTKVAIGQLVEKGKLSLDDRIGRFLSDYPNAEAREKVTIRHLVEMASGIGDFFGPEFEKTPKGFIRHNRDYLRFFASKPLAFEPGTKQLYSNGGYVVLGEIIAKASGSDYYDYVQKNIFRVAEMKDSAWYEADEIVPNLAEGYTRERTAEPDAFRPEPEKQKEGAQPGSQKNKKTEKADADKDFVERVGEQSRGKSEPEKSRSGWRKNIYTRPARGSAAGGGYATAEDLLRFWQCLYEDKLLSPAFTRWVFGGPEPKADQIKKPEDVNRKEWNLAIAGGAPGINTVVEFDADQGWTVIVLANLDPPSATDIARMVRRYLGAIQE